MLPGSSLILTRIAPVRNYIGKFFRETPTPYLYVVVPIVMPTRGRHFLFPSAKKGLDKPAPAGYNNTIVCGFSSSGRAPPCQGGGSEFESRNPLQQKAQGISSCAFLFVVSLRETRTGQSARIATVRGTVAVPACVPVRAEAHRASLVIRSNKKARLFALLFLFYNY